MSDTEYLQEHGISHTSVSRSQQVCRAQTMASLLRSALLGRTFQRAREKIAIEQGQDNAPQLPNVSQTELDQVLPTSFCRANTEKLSNEQLVNFMKRYPPALWKDREGSEKQLCIRLLPYPPTILYY